MKPRSFTPLCRIPRSSSRSTAWWKVACDSANARWCTQPGSVAGVEVDVALRLVVEVRLLEHEGHAEHALPEVDRGLAVRADDRDVVDALALELPHHRSSSLDL